MVRALHRLVPEGPYRDCVLRSYPARRLLSLAVPDERVRPVEHAAYILNPKGVTHEEKRQMDFGSRRCRIIGLSDAMEFFDAGGRFRQSRKQGARSKQSRQREFRHSKQ